MKAYCKPCGIHFPEEFEDTLKPRCEFWKVRELEELPEEFKRKLWDWLFSLNIDEIYSKTGEEIFAGFGKADPGIPWHKVIPLYEHLSEEDQRRVQKIFFQSKRTAGDTPVVLFCQRLADLAKQARNRVKSYLAWKIFVRRTGSYVQKAAKNKQASLRSP